MEKGTLPEIIITIKIFILVTRCPYDATDPNTVCDCSKAPGWVKRQWPDLWCYGGKCYSGIAHDNCTGKDNGHPLGDGTWCHTGRRDTKCQIIAGKKEYLLGPTLFNNCLI